MTAIINAKKITKTLQKNITEDAGKIHEILKKSLELKGLELDEIAALMVIKDKDLLQELFTTAKYLKEKIYGKRLVLFAPLYISNLCSNECLYCAFRASNKVLKRRSLAQTEIAAETKQLIDQGQKRVLLVAGEIHTKDALQYVLDAIKTVYSVKSEHGEIRRINVNIAPLTTAEFRQLKQAQIGTYQLFQETYHQETYKKVHAGGKKSDYDWRLTAIDRAMEAGLDDVGIGILFGLADWRFEVLALIQHAKYLDNKYGIGPHTISVPRIEPATGSELSENPPHIVSDDDFCKLIAILRLAVPYTGIILSTRETAQTRRTTLELGVSQISAGSRTNPGGYDKAEANASQFSLGDHRSLDAVIKDVASLGYIPSFCTGCYRLGRTGHDFMDLAKPGAIKAMCQPNAITTFTEYLLDYASPATKKVGENLIQKELAKMSEPEKNLIQDLINQIKSGKRDVYI
jgi:2-iminoacetate synthase